MLDYQNQLGSNVIVESSAFTKLFRSVFVWMSLALVLTGMTAFYVAGYLERHLDFLAQHQGLFWVFAIAELAVVFILSARLHKMSFMTSGIMFAIYSILNGITLSTILLVYTRESVATTFFVTAGTFAVMSFIGYTTKKDLTSFSKLFMMLLIGLVIATIVNIFWANSTLGWVITYVGVVLFVGLTAFDTQKIKNMLLQVGVEDNEMSRKVALMGSLQLYLDFINLFIYLLRILGDRRE
ncbi:MAG: Bax inhibitor-1/YccA family protein [Bacteroidaceae bacterium]|nr:Bax inhibitor-1/YccA family protein [Candidatus Minthousia equi]MCQ2245278.1 Bax inhibitor-1/YccA family protein [Bacteroidaceae bacterium]